MAIIATPLPQRLHNTDRLELNRNSWQAAGLVGWWPLGYDNTGKYHSRLGNPNVPYKIGGSLQTPDTAGMPNKSAGERTGMYFDGNYNALDIGVNQYTAPNGAVDFSVMCWSRLDNVQQIYGAKSLVSRKTAYAQSFDFGFGKT